MHKWIALFLVCGTAAQAGEDCDASLGEILEHYVAARGGHEALEAQTALRIVSTNHEGKWNPRFDYRTMKPGYMWIEATYDDGEVVIEGFDGQRGWEKWGDKPASYVADAAGQALNQGAQSPVHLYGLHHMETLGADVSLLGCESLDDEPYYVINVRAAFGSDIDYYIDRRSYRLRRSRTTRPLHPTVDPTPIIIEERWRDFRRIDGVLHPFAFSLVNVDTGEELSWLEVHSIEALADATAGDFAMPD